MTYTEKVPGCECHTCRKSFLSASDWFLFQRMILCPECGNKRCPKANYHGWACTGSNDTGQLGSAYP